MKLSEEVREALVCYLNQEEVDNWADRIAELEQQLDTNIDFVKQYQAELSEVKE